MNGLVISPNCYTYPSGYSSGGRRSGGLSRVFFEYFEFLTRLIHFRCAVCYVILPRVGVFWVFFNLLTPFKKLMLMSRSL